MPREALEAVPPLRWGDAGRRAVSSPRALAGGNSCTRTDGEIGPASGLGSEGAPSQATGLGRRGRRRGLPRPYGRAPPIRPVRTGTGWWAIPRRWSGTRSPRPDRQASSAPPTWRRLQGAGRPGTKPPSTEVRSSAVRSEARRPRSAASHLFRLTRGRTRWWEGRHPPAHGRDGWAAART